MLLLTVVYLTLLFCGLALQEKYKGVYTGPKVRWTYLGAVLIGLGVGGSVTSLLLYLTRG